MKTLQQAANEAIQVQDACNSSGVARAMVEAMDAIRAAGQHPNQHAIVFLYLYKLMALNGHEPLNLWTEYDEAVKACEVIQSQAEIAVADSATCTCVGTHDGHCALTGAVAA